MPNRFYWVLLAAVPLEAGYIVLNRLGDLKRFVVEYILIFLANSLFYIASCWWITQSKKNSGDRRRLALILLAGLVFRLTLAPLYPSLTDDPYRYRWEGKLLAAGGNPYLERPEDDRWANLRDRTWNSVNRKDLPTAYGPLVEWCYRLTYAVVSRLEPDEFRQVWRFKIPFLVFDLGAAAMLIG